jgi:hypothetical protein
LVTRTLSDAAAVTETVPETVAPFAGDRNDTVGRCVSRLIRDEPDFPAVAVAQQTTTAITAGPRTSDERRLFDMVTS